MISAASRLVEEGRTDARKDVADVFATRRSGGRAEGAGRRSIGSVWDRRDADAPDGHSAQHEFHRRRDRRSCGRREPGREKRRLRRGLAGHGNVSPVLALGHPVGFAGQRDMAGVAELIGLFPAWWLAAHLPSAPCPQSIFSGLLGSPSTSAQVTVASPRTGMKSRVLWFGATESWTSVAKAPIVTESPM